MRMITVTIHNKKVQLAFIRSTYICNGNTYIGALNDGELWCDISINLYRLNNPTRIFISDSCNIEIIQALEDMRLIRATGRYECSGFSYYPEYELSKEFLDHWCISS